MSEIPEPLLAMLKQASAESYFVVADSKLKCTLNDHCIPLNKPEQLSTFLSGKKFKKLLEQQAEPQKLNKLEPFLVPSKRLPGYLFCALTKQLVRAKLDVARQHMKGLRFLKAKERFCNDWIDLFDEPEEEEAKPVRRQALKAGAGTRGTLGGTKEQSSDGEVNEGETDRSDCSDEDLSDGNLDIVPLSDASGSEDGPMGSSSEGESGGAAAKMQAPTFSRKEKKLLRKHKKLERRQQKLRALGKAEASGKRTGAESSRMPAKRAKTR